MEFGKKKPEETFRDELRILAVQIETINQQLASGTGGSGGPAAGKAFNDMNAKLSFLYEYLKTMDAEFRQEAKTSMEQVQGSVNTTLQKNLGDIYARQEELLKAVGKSGGNQEIEDMRSTLKELINVYREEVEVFKQQNQFLQKKLADIDARLQRMEK